MSRISRLVSEHTVPHNPWTMPHAHVHAPRVRRPGCDHLLAGSMYALQLGPWLRQFRASQFLLVQKGDLEQARRLEDARAPPASRLGDRRHAAARIWRALFHFRAADHGLRHQRRRRRHISCTPLQCQCDQDALHICDLGKRYSRYGYSALVARPAKQSASS